MYTMAATKAKVGKSKIHGRGLFATEDIKEGETIYDYGGYDFCQKCMLTNLLPGGLLERCEPYVLGEIETRFYCGDPNIEEPWGYLMNDHWKPNIPKSQNPLDHLDEIINYANNSEMICSVHLRRKCVARRDIKKGEELTCSYGYLYWAKYAMEETLPPRVVSVLCFIRSEVCDRTKLTKEKLEKLLSGTDDELQSLLDELKIENENPFTTEEMDEMGKFVKDFVKEFREQSELAEKRLANRNKVSPKQ